MKEGGESHGSNKYAHLLTSGYYLNLLREAKLQFINQAPDGN